MPRFATYLTLLGALLLLAACDVLETDDAFEQEYVVESYQIALEPLQPVLISRTAGLDERWVFENLAVSDAEVRIQLLDDAGGVEATFPYRERASEPGVYVPADRDHRVLPLRSYALEVVVPGDGQVIGATTLVPDSFQVVTTNADTLVYQGTDQLEIVVTRSFYPGRQNVFVFVSEALDPRVDALTPFAASIFDEDEDDLDDFAVGSSPILNEANYAINPDGTLTINLPWLAIAFYGPTRLTANAVDDNLFDFLRSQFAQENGSTLSPGEIPDVISNVDGARGVFGSMARSVAEAYVARPAP